MPGPVLGLPEASSLVAQLGKFWSDVADRSTAESRTCIDMPEKLAYGQVHGQLDLLDAGPLADGPVAEYDGQR